MMSHKHKAYPDCSSASTLNKFEEEEEDEKKTLTIVTQYTVFSHSFKNKYYACVLLQSTRLKLSKRACISHGMWTSVVMLNQHEVAASDDASFNGYKCVMEKIILIIFEITKVIRLCVFFFQIFIQQVCVKLENK